MNVRLYPFCAFLLFGIPAFAQLPLSCEPYGQGVPDLRAQGHAELVSNLMIQCNNGAAGTGVKYVGIEVSSFPETMPLTSRILDSSSGITEAQLVIDSPLPNRQVVCQTPQNPAACGAANVFPGIRVTSTRIRFVLPFVEPGPGSVRYLQIVNIRVAPSQLPPSATNISLSIVNATVGVPAPQLALPLTTTVVEAGAVKRVDFPVSVSGGPPTYGCEDVNRELALTPFATATADGRHVTLRIRESPSSFVFRPRTSAITRNFIPAAPEAQPYVGIPTQSETGFYNPALPGIYATAGLAGSGTRFSLRVHNVPLHARLLVPDIVYFKSDGSAATTGYARRVGIGYGGVDPFSENPVTSPIGGGIAPMTVLGAFHDAIYEVLVTSQSDAETIEIPIYPALLSSDGGSAALFASVSLLPVSGIESAILPRFEDAPTPLWRVATVNGCNPPSITPQSAALPATGATGNITVTAGSAVAWAVRSQFDWITITSATGGQGNGSVAYAVAENTGTDARIGTISIGPAVFTISQSARPPSPVRLIPEFQQIPHSGAYTGSFRVDTTGPITLDPSAGVTIVSVTNNEVRYIVSPNPSASVRILLIQVNSTSGFLISQPGRAAPLYSNLLFVPVTPCRVADTREASGPFGGPWLYPDNRVNLPRSFPIPASSCGIPAAAKAYALNVTVVPQDNLGYVSIVPTGSGVFASVSTLNAPDRRIKANAAIVAAGADGAISAIASNTTHLVIDINGYFIESAGLAFYPLPPCRVLDTRNPNGALGGPILAGGTARSFPVQSSTCGVPPTAAAYSLNATVVPAGGLGYLTLWPAGQAQPYVSTLNADRGSVVANAAIVPAGTGGAISAFATNDTHLVIDINGYFAPPGSPNALRFTAVTPCRGVDTRLSSGPLGSPMLQGGVARAFPIGFGCQFPDTAKAYSLNATVVPPGGLGYLTMWPTGAVQPYVSTLNAMDDPIVANALIVPAGADGMVSAFATNPSQIILDANGYFAP